ncbi:MAG: methionyl-tRNA formyltransferase [Bacteroidota bacterium]|nr:methionyl-tRNA formyltransferase [Bacteroidota bacterium]
MKKEELRIVFMGTPDFAVEPLRVLVENGYNIAGVITNIDKPAGRGKKINISAVKKYALEQKLTLLQPAKLKSPEFIEELRKLKPDLQIVVAFRMLPEIVWNMPPLGTFNLHASLLPQYRGAAPINWAIMNGETETGLTSFFLQHEIDTGKIIYQEKTNISADENAGQLHDSLMLMGGKLVMKTVDSIIAGHYPQTEQRQFINDIEILKRAPKIFKEDCRIDWSANIGKIYNHIRGLSPYPAAWTEIKNQENEIIQLKIFAVGKEVCKNDLKPGTIHTDSKKYLQVAISDGFINILQLQQAGKKRMKTDDFLRGFKEIEGWRFQ